MAAEKKKKKKKGEGVVKTNKSKKTKANQTTKSFLLAHVISFSRFLRGEGA